MSISLSFSDITSLEATYHASSDGSTAWLDLEIVMKNHIGPIKVRRETITLFAGHAKGFAAAQMQELCGVIQRQTCDENPLPRIVNTE